MVPAWLYDWVLFNYLAVARMRGWIMLSEGWKRDWPS